MSRVKVIALTAGFINGVRREPNEQFSVVTGQELGATWFRPVVVDSIPQGDDEPIVKPKRGNKQRKQESDLPPSPGAEDLG